MNPLNNFSLSGGLDSIKQRLTSPFNNYLSADQRREALKAAHERHDFRTGLVITPINKSGKEIAADIVHLTADAMPHDQLTFGGQQKIVKDYYPGSSEPTVQVLGPQENDITIKGRFYAKRLKVRSPDGAIDEELWRMYPVALQQAIESIRLNGFLIKIELGDQWRRYGFIQEAVFDMKTLADIGYTITFLIVGFNPPKDFIMVDKQSTIPYNANKQLLQSVSALQATSITPAEMPKSFADQIKGAISDVAAAANLVTGFVDTVLAEVNSLKDSVQRALGLIKNARNKISQYQRVVGGQNPQAGVPKSNSISTAYANAVHVAKVSKAMNVTNSSLAALSDQLKKITQTIPLARHRVQNGDTLHKLAMKYYNDSSQWEVIYDHNKLTSSALTIGAILEIPRV